MPSCLVVSHMPILPPTTYGDVNGRRFNSRADLLSTRRQQPEPLLLRHSQLRPDAAIKVLLHERTEVIRMTRGQRATLPVQALVHVEDKETSQRNFAPIYQLRERRIP